MNQGHLATIGAAGVGGAAVGILIWLLSTMGVIVPENVSTDMEILVTAAGGYWFHRKITPENPTQGQG